MWSTHAPSSSSRRAPWRLYPIVLETEDNGAVSAYVPGLPVYATADSHAKTERAIRAVLTEYLNAHPARRPDARVRVARLSDTGKRKVEIVGVAALVGAKRTAERRASRKPRAALRSARCGDFAPRYEALADPSPNPSAERAPLQLCS
jgi:hypothetical protein